VGSSFIYLGIALCERWRENFKDYDEKKTSKKAKMGPRKRKRLYHLSPSTENKENQRDLAFG
jgi:hypothetical protein